MASVRRRLLRSALVTGGLWLLVLASTVLALAWFLSGPDGWVRGSAAPLTLDLILLVGGVAGCALLVRSLRRRLREPRIAEAMDRIGGLGSGTVLGSLEVSRDAPPGVSPALVRRSEENVLGSLPADPDHLTGSLGGALRRWTRRGAITLAVVGVGLAALVAWSPDRALSAWDGLLRPTTVLATPPLPSLSVDPAGGELPRGSELEVTVHAPDRDEVRLRWQFDGDVARTRDAAVRNGRATVSLGDLDAPVEYRAEAPDGARTERFRVVPLDPLLVTDLRVELVFPPHTGLQARQFQREVPPLEIPEGTNIRFEGRASRPLDRVSLRPAPVEGSPDAGLELDVEADRFSGRWQPRTDGRYEWQLRTPDGEVPETAPPPLDVTVVRDSTPSIELVFPGADTVLPLDRRQPLEIRARDDHGIAGLEVVALRVSSTGERGEPVVRELRTGSVRGATARPVLDVSDWELLPGDTVRYRARVTDNAPRPRTAESREYALRVPRRSEAAREIQERIESATEAVDSLRADAARAGAETREMERQGLEGRSSGGDAAEPGNSDERRTPSSSSPSTSGERQEASFESREEVRRALEQQEELLSRADSVRSELEEARRSMDETALADPELRRDLEELQELMSEAAPEEMSDEVQRTSEQLDEMDTAELQQALEQLAQDQEAFRDQLEQSLDRFRRAAAEQDFRSTARETRELAQEQSALADALETDEGEEDTRAEQQEELSGRAGELQERMERLEERLSALGEEQARQGVEQARERSEEASGAMSDASRLSREQQTQDAGQAARSATEDLQQSADDLDRARQEMAERRADQASEALQRAATEALSLARRQGELQERMPGADREERGEIRADEAAIREGLENLSSSLPQSSAQPGRSSSDASSQPSPSSDLSSQSQSSASDSSDSSSPSSDSSSPSSQGSQSSDGNGDDGSQQGVQEALQDATEAVEQTMEALQDQGGSASPTEASGQAVEALNSLARAAGRSARQQGGPQDGQGGSQMQQELQDLARRQAGLSDRSGALQPLQLGERSLQRQLMQIAGEQGRLAEDLGQLSQRPGSGEQTLGDLERMAEEARDLSRELEGGRLDPETVRRQERLFHRLLDAGRSLERDEPSSDQRESRTAESTEIIEVDPLTEEDMGGIRFQLPSGEILQDLPPAQRALVIRYFERLNRSGEVAPPAEGDGR